ncbi:MAG: PAS domain-containing protein [Actinobacteria bacterium]|nr:PAS domain-containing protein [Actinomycetota bacterium]
MDRTAPFHPSGRPAAVLDLLAEALPQDPNEVWEAIRAIRGGEVDALVVCEDEQDRVFLLEPALRPYQDLVQRMGDGAVIVDLAGMVRYANDRLVAMSGRPREELIGNGFLELVHPDDRARWSAFL